MHRLLSPALFLVTVSAVAQPQTGTITGTVELRLAAAPPRTERGLRYRSGSSMAGMEDHARPVNEERNVIVSLEGPGLDQRRVMSPERATMNQRDATFVPRVLAVERGTVVTFTNEDKTYHNVFSLSPAKRFNIGRRPTGEAVPVRFDRTGVVQIFCDIHSHMTAFIVVLDNPYFVKPDADGRFTLADVPPGRYTLHVWHERLSTPPISVEVRPGATTTVKAVLE